MLERRIHIKTFCVVAFLLLHSVSVYGSEKKTKTVKTAKPACSAVLVFAPGEIVPGKNGNVLVTLFNSSQDSVVLNVFPELPRGWSLLNHSMMIELAPNSKKTISLILVPDVLADVGIQKIAFNFIDTEFKYFIEKTVAIQILPMHRLAVKGISNPRAIALSKSENEVHFRIENLGNVTESFEVKRLSDGKKIRLSLPPKQDTIYSFKFRLPKDFTTEVFYTGLILTPSYEKKEIRSIISMKVMPNTIYGQRPLSNTVWSFSNQVNYSAGARQQFSTQTNVRGDVDLSKNGKGYFMKLLGSHFALQNGPQLIDFYRGQFIQGFRTKTGTHLVNMGLSNPNTDFYYRLNSAYQTLNYQYSGTQVLRPELDVSLRRGLPDNSDGFSYLIDGNGTLSGQSWSLAASGLAGLRNGNLELLGRGTGEFHADRADAQVSVMGFNPNEWSDLGVNWSTNVGGDWWSISQGGFVSGATFSQPFNNSVILNSGVRMQGKRLRFRAMHNRFQTDNAGVVGLRDGYSYNISTQIIKGLTATYSGRQNITSRRDEPDWGVSNMSNTVSLSYQKETFGITVNGNVLDGFASKSILDERISRMVLVAAEGTFRINSYTDMLMGWNLQENDFFSQSTFLSSLNVQWKSGTFISGNVRIMNQFGQANNTIANGGFQFGKSGKFLNASVGTALILNGVQAPVYQVNTNLSYQIPVPKRMKEKYRKVTVKLVNDAGTPVEGVVLEYNKHEGITNKNGRVSFRNILGTNQSLSLDKKSLPFGMYVLEDRNIRVPDSVRKSDIVLKTYAASKIRGGVYFERTGILQNVQPNYRNYVVVCKGANEPLLATLKEDGSFQFDKIFPGSYTVELKYIGTGEGDWQIVNGLSAIDVLPGRSYTVDFKLLEKAKNLKFQKTGLKINR